MFLLPHRIRRLIKESRLFHETSVLVELAPWDKLTFREQEVAALVHLMYSNEEMAETLSVSLATIKSHLDHIFKKLNVHSKREVRLLFGEWPVKEWWDSTHHN